ncbi:MAG: alpha/beta hydrolase [Opitutaceae bacterium]
MPESLTEDGFRLHFTIAGSGSIPLFFLHGMGGTKEIWAQVWAALDRSRFRGVFLDLRGHGESAAASGSFTNDRLAADVLAVADHLGIERFAVVGHSSGGKVVLCLAAIAPQRVSQLVLIGAVGPGQVVIEREMAGEVFRRSHDQGFIQEAFRPWFRDWPNVEFDRVLAMFSRTPKWALRAVGEMALWTDISAQVGSLATPTLLMAGAADPLYGPSYQEQSVRPCLLNSEMVTLDCGHFHMTERPAEVAGHLARFLVGTATPSPC